MNSDRVIGALIMIGSIAGIVLYAWLLFLTEWSLVALQFTGLIAVGGVLLIVAWIGYSLVTTPPPQPVEDLREEVEIGETEST